MMKPLVKWLFSAKYRAQRRAERVLSHAKFYLHKQDGRGNARAITILTRKIFEIRLEM